MNKEYLTPYVTCAHCNTLSFLDLESIQAESLPACPKCNKTLSMITGAVPSQILKTNPVAISSKLKSSFLTSNKTIASAITAQRIFRGYVARKAYQKVVLEAQEAERLRTKAVISIQAFFRGIIGRRTFHIQSCLSIIKDAHEIVLNSAIYTNTSADKSTVTWYSDPLEIQVLFLDYREFVYRTGNNPPLIAVENNLIKVAKRVLQREYILVTRIQARWRGITGRVMMATYKLEKAKIFSSRFQPIIKIQRLFGHHRGCHRMARVRAASKDLKRLYKYKSGHQISKETKQSQSQKDKIKLYYKRAFKEAQVARMTGASVSRYAQYLHYGDEKHTRKERPLEDLRLNPMGIYLKTGASAKAPLELEKSHVKLVNKMRKERSSGNQEASATTKITKSSALSKLSKPARRLRPSFTQVLHRHTSSSQVYIPQDINDDDEEDRDS